MYLFAKDSIRTLWGEFELYIVQSSIENTKKCKNDLFQDEKIIFLADTSNFQYINYNLNVVIKF